MNPYTVFWRPSDLSQKEFEAYKAAILKDANSCGMIFEFTESAEDLDTLLDSVRGEKNPETSRPAVIIVIDEASKSKNAVTIVEVEYYNFELEKETFPDANDSRKFLASPFKVPLISCNLELANCDWVDFAEEADPEKVHEALF